MVAAVRRHSAEVVAAHRHSEVVEVGLQRSSEVESARQQEDRGADRQRALSRWPSIS